MRLDIKDLHTTAYDIQAGNISRVYPGVIEIFHTSFRRMCKIRASQEKPLENHYHVLGVSPTATGEEIKKAYRSLAMRHHPDRSTHPGAQGRFNAIKTAYETLSDQKKRTVYNQSLNNRIILDPDNEAHALWSALFERCGAMVSPDGDASR